MARIKDLMTKKVVTIKPGTDLKKVCRLLTQNRISGAPVVNEKREIIGFVSERDIVAAIPKRGFSSKTVKDVMKKKVVSVKDSASVNEALTVFSNKPYRLLPVTHDGKLVGTISRHSLVTRMLGYYY